MQKRRFIIYFCLFVMTLGFVVPVYLINYYSNSFEHPQADTLIILGCRLYGDVPSLLLRYRLDKALELYDLGLAKNIIVSGSMGPGETVTEAYAMKKYLVERGVSPDRVFKEDQSYNTYQNLKYSYDIMHQQGFDSAIIVSNDFHIFRALVLARKFGMTATGAPSDMPTIWGMRTRYVLREVPAVYREIIMR